MKRANYLSITLAIGVSLSLVNGISAATAQPVQSDLGISDEDSYQQFKSAMCKSEYFRTGYSIEPSPRAVASVTALMVFASQNPLATESELTDFLTTYNASLMTIHPGDPDLEDGSSFFPAVLRLDRGSTDFTQSGFRIQLSDRIFEALDVLIPAPVDFESTRNRMVQFDQSVLRLFSNSSDWSLVLLLGLYGQDLDGQKNSHLPVVIESFLSSEGYELVPDGIDDERFSLTTMSLNEMPADYSTFDAMLTEVNTNPMDLDNTVLQDNLQFGYTQIQSRNSVLIDEIKAAMIDPPSVIEAEANSNNPAFLAQQEAEYEEDLLAVSGMRASLNWNSMMILQSNQAEAQAYAQRARRFSHIQLETDDTLSSVKSGIEVVGGFATFAAGAASGDYADAFGGLTDAVLGSFDLADAFGAFDSPPPPEEQMFDQIVMLREDIDEMRTEMHDRFNRVEQQLNLVYVSMVNSFEMIGNQIGDLQADVDDLGRSMAVQRAALDRIEEALYGMFSDTMWLDLAEKVDLVLNYRGSFGTDLQYEGATSFINSSSALKSWTTTGASSTIYAGPLVSPLTDFDLADAILSGSSIGRNINDLRVFPSVLGLPALHNDRVVASAPWTQGASVYAQLAFENPWYFAYMYNSQTQAAGTPDLDSIITKGEDLVTVMENGRDPALFDAMLDGYLENIEALDTLESNIFSNLSNEIEGVDPFGGLTQPIAQTQVNAVLEVEGQNFSSDDLQLPSTADSWNLFHTNNDEQDIAPLSLILVTRAAAEYNVVPTIFFGWNMNLLVDNEVLMNFGFTVNGNGGDPTRNLRVQTNRQLRMKIYNTAGLDPVFFNGSREAMEYFSQDLVLWSAFRPYLLNDENLTGQSIHVPNGFGDTSLIEIISDHYLNLPHINGRQRTLELLQDIQIEGWETARDDGTITTFTDRLNNWAVLLDAYATMSMPDLLEDSTVARSALRGVSDERSFGLAVDVEARYALNALDPENAISIYDRLNPSLEKLTENIEAWLNVPFPGHAYINFILSDLRTLKDHAFDLAIDDRYEFGLSDSVEMELGLLSNDIDQQYRTIEVNSFTQPTNGSVVVNPDGSFSFDADPGFEGMTSFEYTSRSDITLINGEPQFYETNPATVVLLVRQDNATCDPDLNEDGVLDFFDISSFLSAYAAMDPAADFSGDGLFDFFDVSAFLTAFGVGCP